MSKTTVENCTTIYVWEHEREVKDDLRAAGQYEAVECDAQEDGETDLPASARCSVSWGKSDDATNWEHRHQRKQELRYVATPCHFGGFRLWFKCYATAEESGHYYGCYDRVGTLYKPLGGDVFLCRDCWDLQYESQRRTDDKTPSGAMLAATSAEMKAVDNLEANPFARENWHQLYEAKQHYSRATARFAEQYE